MSFLQDKEYEEMDWLNLAIEGYTFSLNDVLVTMPNRIEITPDLIYANIAYNEISVRAILKPYLPENLPSHECAGLIDAFSFHSEETETILFNFQTSKLSAPYFLVKDITLFEGEQLAGIVLDFCLAIIRRSLGHAVRIPEGAIGRVNEIMDFMTLDNKSRSSKNWHKKIRMLQIEYGRLIKEDKWKIRNMDLIVKSAEWACSYISTGNLAALTNFNKLKVMTHKKQPIYSMTETI